MRSVIFKPNYFHSPLAKKRPLIGNGERRPTPSTNLSVEGDCPPRHRSMTYDEAASRLLARGRHIPGSQLDQVVLGAEQKKGS